MATKKKRLVEDEITASDLNVEDILANRKNKQKKKRDGHAKGGRTELQLCKFLTDHFGETFSKAPGSGARIHQVKFLPEHAKKTLCGDICVPEGFVWVLECKGGYEDAISINAIADGKPSACLDEMFEVLEHDSTYSGRKPMLLWKRARRPWLAMVKASEIAGLLPQVQYHIRYREWAFLTLDELLSLTERDFWYGAK